MIQQCRETQRGSNFIDSDITPGCRNESYPPPLGRYSVRGTCRPGTLFSGQAGIRILITSGAIILLLACACFAYTDTQIADAIFKAEGGYKATYLYGIRSIPYETEVDARRICLNTIKNQRKRHLRHDCGKDYLACLAERYCPTKGKLSHAERKLNRHWLDNVEKFLRKGVN